MGIYRVYTGDNGKSHLEDLEATEHALLRESLPGRGFFFKRFPPGTQMEPHPAPRRMITVIVSGELELTFGDGTSRTFVPGDVRLMEDTSAEGHVTRVIGDKEVVIAVVPLPQDGEYF